MVPYSGSLDYGKDHIWGRKNGQLSVSIYSTLATRCLYFWEGRHPLSRVLDIYILERDIIKLFNSRASEAGSGNLWWRLLEAKPSTKPGFWGDGASWHNIFSWIRVSPRPIHHECWVQNDHISKNKNLNKKVMHSKIRLRTLRIFWDWKLFRVYCHNLVAKKNRKIDFSFA